VTRFKVANVVGTITYQQEIDLDELAQTFKQREEVSKVTYNPVESHWLQTWFTPDDTYVAFYREGKCTIAGAKSLEHLQEVVEQVNTVLRDILRFEYKPEVEVKNIVATAEVGSNIPLEILALELGMDRTEYEPEQFPALIYRGEDYVVLAFSNGKLLCTGLDKIEDIDAAIDEMVDSVNNTL
jgi:transcription initiation factor TFIID TATA-box-binding protein